MSDLLTYLTAYANRILDEAALAAQSSYVGKAMESMAVRRMLESAHLRYPHNDLVEHLARQLLASADASRHLPPEFSLDTALANSVDSADVRRFIYELAEASIEAAGRGLLATGERVTYREARFLEALKVRLGIP